MRCSCLFQFETRQTLSRFEGSNSISSSQFFGNEPAGGRKNYSSNAPDLQDIKDGVRQGVTKVAGKLSNLASGVMSSLQVRVGRLFFLQWGMMGEGGGGGVENMLGFFFECYLFTLFFFQHISQLCLVVIFENFSVLVNVVLIYLQKILTSDRDLQKCFDRM